MIIFSSESFSQCLVEHWDLEQKVKHSAQIIEGTITSQDVRWDNQKKLIYTLNTIQISRIFKGDIEKETIIVATEGGFIGNEGLKVYPTLELKKDETGVFFLKNKNTHLFYETVFLPAASSQSMILYDLYNFEAFDGHKKFLSIPFELYPAIKKYTEASIKNVNPIQVTLNPDVIVPLNAPIISGINVDTATAGTDFNITISGSNFGSNPGRVGFRDANFGDNRFYFPSLGNSYISWSDNQIVVRVPSRAGTGTIQVINENGNSGISQKSLFVKWAHSNVTSNQGNDTNFFQPRVTNTNSKGGISWRMNTKFANNTQAVNAFLRALVDWRCETGMNWDFGTNTTTDEVAREGINSVRFTKYDDSKLGVCYSWYSGCTQAGVTSWFVAELDIEFDSTRNWHYGTGSPASNQMDFQSVALHELGHGVQMGHVRDNSKVMHFSIGNGTRKATLVASDIEGGKYVVNRSTTGVCGRSPITVVPKGDCVIGVPKAALSIAAVKRCVGETIVFTNQTSESVNTFVWNFGMGASPAFAATAGPHNVTYSTPGVKSIKLTVINDFGQDVLDTTFVIEPNQINAPVFSMSSPTCLGENNYAIPLVSNALSYQWSVSDNGTIVGADNESNLVVTWDSGEKALISVKAIGECVESDETKDSSELQERPEPLFDYNNDKGTVTFENKSKNATSYSWDFGNGNTSTDENPVYFFASNGTFEVILKALSDCGSDSLVQEVMVDNHVGLNNLSNTIVAYPNPIKSGGTLFVDLNTYPQEVWLTALDGRQVKITEFNLKSIQLPKLSAGIYTLSIISATQKHILMVLIE
jgi:PKD repeat protein